MKHEWRVEPDIQLSCLPAMLSQLESMGWEIVTILPSPHALRESYASVVSRKRLPLQQRIGLDGMYYTITGMGGE